MGQLAPNLESPDACEPKANESDDTFAVRWLQAHANANGDKIKAANKPSKNTTVKASTVLVLPAVQRQPFYITATAILYHCARFKTFR